MPEKEAFFYPGPEPVLEAPPLADALAAEKALRENGAITPEQAEILVKWMVNQTREALMYCHFFNATPNPDEEKAFFKRQSLNDYCADGQAGIASQAEKLNIAHYAHGVSKITSYTIKDWDETGAGHSFSVIHIPVIQSEGSIRDKKFLLDTTFRQFFIDSRKCVERNNNSGEKISVEGWGTQLLKTQEGKHVVDTILRDGYIELTPDVAHLYIGAAQRDEATGANIGVAPPDLMERLSCNTEAICPDTIEYESMLTPSMVARMASGPASDRFADRVSTRASQERIISP